MNEKKEYTKFEETMLAIKFGVDCGLIIGLVLAMVFSIVYIVNN